VDSAGDDKERTKKRRTEKQTYRKDGCDAYDTTTKWRSLYLRVAALVIISREKVVEPGVASFVQKPLDVGAWQSTQCVEAEGSVFDHHGTTNFFSCKLQGWGGGGGGS
jgi:hypothetical protein